MALLKGKDVLVGVIDVASDKVETPAEVAATIGRALKYVPKNRLFPCTNCGMAPRSCAVGSVKSMVDQVVQREEGEGGLAVGGGHHLCARGREAGLGEPLRERLAEREGGLAERLRELRDQPAGAIRDRIFEDVFSFSSCTEAGDDMTLVVVKRSP